MYGVPTANGIPGEEVYLFAGVEEGYKPVKATTDDGNSFDFVYHGPNHDNMPYYSPIKISESAISMSASITCAKAWTASSDQGVVFEEGGIFAEGETVKCSIKVPVGHKIATVKATTASGKDVAVTVDAPYASFTMPAEDVKVAVTYEELVSEDKVTVIAHFDEDQYSVRSSTNYDWNFKEGFTVDKDSTFYTTTGEMPNSNLTWESTTQVNAGLDMGLADDRVRVSFDYYDKVTRNLLFDVALPNTTGYGSVVSNVGKVRFYGVDLAISSVNISRGDFTWTTDFTYNFNMNKVLKLPDNGNVRNRMDGITIGDGSQFGGIAEGERMGRIYGYKVDHIIETQADADAAMYDASSRGYRRSDRRQIAGRKDIGDYEWVNRAGSTQRDGRDIINEEDQFLLGYATPHSTGGIGNTFRYRNWSLNIYMDYALGHSIQNEMQMRYFMATMGNCNWNLVNDVKQCWSQPGDKTKYARFTANDPDWGNRNFSRMSDVFVEKGDYLCIRDISLSYKLPVRWTSRLGMKDVTLTVSGNTLYYWTAVHGVSPEAATTGGLYNSASTYATGFSPYPPARKILFSAKFTF